MSIHDKLKRVRKPRVHITYDVETEGAAVKKELPFVVGVMGDFSGDNTEALKPLKDRRFIQIDRDNFNDVLKRMSPSLRLKVDNTLTDDGSQFEVNLNFKSIVAHHKQQHALDLVGIDDTQQTPSLAVHQQLLHIHRQPLRP